MTVCVHALVELCGELNGVNLTDKIFLSVCFVCIAANFIRMKHVSLRTL